jgi:cytochrome b561
MIAMAWKSSSERYGSVAMVIHWATALAILGLLWAGFTAADTADEAAKIQLLRLHTSAGITVFALTLLRIGWWLFADRRPQEAAGLPRWQAMSSRIVHLALYLVVIVLGASGIGMMALSGAGDVLWGDAVGLPDFTEYGPRFSHGLAARLLILLTVLHVVAALYHQFVRKDGTLSRMLP